MLRFAGIPVSSCSTRRVPPVAKWSVVSVVTAQVTEKKLRHPVDRDLWPDPALLAKLTNGRLFVPGSGSKQLWRNFSGMNLSRAMRRQRVHQDHPTRNR